MPGISHAFPLRLALLALLLAGRFACAQIAPALEVVISVPEQRLVVLCSGGWVAKYPVSTSKFGTGDAFGSYKTPLGRMRVCEKIGDGFASGAVMKGRAATGEIIPVNAPGRDPIVTRILWLEGMEEQNRNARSRAIYIHGTPEEERIGDPVSWGCIRMRSRDVLALFDELPVGTPVTILAERLPRVPRFDPRQLPMIASHAEAEPIHPIASIAVGKTKAPPLLSAAPAHGSSDPLQAMKGSILFSGLDALADASEEAVAVR